MNREKLLQKAMKAFLKEHKGEYKELVVDDNSIQAPFLIQEDFSKKLLLAFLKKYSGPLINDVDDIQLLMDPSVDVGVLDALMLLVPANELSEPARNMLLKDGTHGLSSPYGGMIALPMCAKRVKQLGNEISRNGIVESKLNELKNEQWIIANVCINIINEVWLDGNNEKDYDWWSSEDKYYKIMYERNKDELQKVGYGEQPGFPEWCKEFLKECEQISGRLTQLCHDKRMNRAEWPESTIKMSYYISAIDIILNDTVTAYNTGKYYSSPFEKMESNIKACFELNEIDQLTKNAIIEHIRFMRVLKFVEPNLFVVEPGLSIYGDAIKIIESI